MYACMLAALFSLHLCPVPVFVPVPVLIMHLYLDKCVYAMCLFLHVPARVCCTCTGACDLWLSDSLSDPAGPSLSLCVCMYLNRTSVPAPVPVRSLPTLCTYPSVCLCCMHAPASCRSMNSWLCSCPLPCDCTCLTCTCTYLNRATVSVLRHTTAHLYLYRERLKAYMGFIREEKEYSLGGLGA